MEKEKKKGEESLAAQEKTISTYSTTSASSSELVGWGYLAPEVALSFFAFFKISIVTLRSYFI